MDTELERWRQDTPAIAGGVIHLNNAGASLVPTPVVDAVVDYLRREAMLGGYETAAAERDRIAATYDDVARLIGAAPRNVAVVENATVAVIQALDAFDFRPGDLILTTRNDYVSNQIMYLALARRRGVEVVRADDLPEGGVDPESIRAHIARRRPALVAVAWIPTSSGLVQPVEAIGEICAGAGVPYLIDACQAVGQLPIDAPALHCDFLAATGRKFLRGPRGTGFLYVSDRALADGRYPLHLDMRGADWVEPDAFRLADSARRFENWEFNYALVIGLGEAARYALEVGVDRAGRRAAELAAYARDRLAGIDGVRVLDRGRRLCAIATVELRGRIAGDVVRRLRQHRIHTSSIDRASALLDMDEKHATTALRVSPHYFNTREEIDTAVESIAGVVGGG